VPARCWWLLVCCAPVQIVEAGLGHLPFMEKAVTTPTGHTYVGTTSQDVPLCGVSEGVFGQQHMVRMLWV
jgi:hypothetical protein